MTYKEKCQVIQLALILKNQTTSTNYHLRSKNMDLKHRANPYDEEIPVSKALWAEKLWRSPFQCLLLLNGKSREMPYYSMLQISRFYLPCITKTSPFPLPTALGNHHFTLCFLEFVILDSTWKWNHIVFVFLCLLYFTYHNAKCICMLQMTGFPSFLRLSFLYVLDIISWLALRCKKNETKDESRRITSTAVLDPVILKMSCPHSFFFGSLLTYGLS